jgi:tight adherence protein C
MEANYINSYFSFIPEHIPEISYLFQFLSTFLLIFGISKIIYSTYKSHSYLYNLEDRNQIYDNWVEALLPLSRKLVLKNYRKNIKLNLSRSGWRPEWGMDHFISAQILHFSLSFILLFLVVSILLGVSILVPLIFSIGIGLYPSVNLRTRAEKRIGSINRGLGGFIEYLSLAISAGLDFKGALQEACDNYEAGPIRDEFSLVNKSISLGKSRAEALRDLKTRLMLPSVTLFIETLVQSMEQGASIVDILHSIASNLNTKRFQSAEEEAGKISIKMMIPLVVFILPAVMLVLMGPMILEYVLISN